MIDIYHTPNLRSLWAIDHWKIRECEYTVDQRFQRMVDIPKIAS
jgi:hypothetical protein